MVARDLMTWYPSVVTKAISITKAAALMRKIGVGAIPVVDALAERHLEGIITDRDIVTRCVADGHTGDCTVSDHMSTTLHTVEEDDTSAHIISLMERHQVRRILVISKDRRLVGIIAQADLATKLGPMKPHVVEGVLEALSAPAGAQTIEPW